jgi:hypothetical protein
MQDPENDTQEDGGPKPERGLLPIFVGIGAVVLVIALAGVIYNITKVFGNKKSARPPRQSFAGQPAPIPKPKEIPPEPVLQLVLPTMSIDSLPLLPSTQTDSTGQHFAFQLLASHVSSENGYSLMYDSTRQRLRYGWGGADFALLDSQGLTISIELIVCDPLARGDFRDHLLDCAIHTAQSHCAADGPDGSSWCENATPPESFRTEQGLRVLRFYQTYFESGHDGLDSMMIGPYYALDLSRGGNRLGLMIYNDRPSPPRDEYIIRALVNSVTRVSP